MLAIPCFIERRAGLQCHAVDPTATPPLRRNTGVKAVQLHIKCVRDCYVVTASVLSPPAGKDTFRWQTPADSEVIVTDVLEAGAYAVVKVANENSFRAVQAQPAELGRAGGHAGLATDSAGTPQPVIFAGEICFDDNGELTAWTSVSGTYQLPDEYVLQSELPAEMYHGSAYKDRSAHHGSAFYKQTFRTRYVLI